MTAQGIRSMRYAQQPRLVTLHNRHGMTVTLMDWGATWLSCQVPLADGAPREVLLGCANAELYDRQQVYLGATIGRYANRIANAHLPYPNGDRQLVASQGCNLLHGGQVGFDKQRWSILEHSLRHVRFLLNSPDGDQGFPGNLDIEVTYTLDDDNSLSVRMRARSDQLTPVNLTNHAYFNLDGVNGDVRQHQLQVRAARMLPIDGAGIPLGDIASVDGTGFDFRHPKRLAQDFLQDEQQKIAKGYDHSFVLDAAGTQTDDWAARLTSGDGRLTLELATTLPALQLYTGNYLAGTPARDGGEYRDYSGVALEPQFLPDSPHHPEWPQPSCWLAAGQVYDHTICYRFR